MKMKLLMENWRGFKLHEAMKTPEELPEGVGVLINTENSPEEISIMYVDLHTGGPSQNPKGEVVIGNIPSEYTDYYGSCLNAWVVVATNAEQGWGPMLYDVAIEWASMRGSGMGLAPDRVMVSDRAYEVWDHYMKNRSDVEAVQLDSPDNELTSDERDNCAQNSAVSSAGRKGMEWHQTPISKVYKKKNAEMIRKLQAAQKLVFREEQLAEDNVPGGMADYRGTKDFNPTQLQKGIEHEMEHTNDPKIAKEIAMDHLAEDPNYYDDLEKMEK